MLLRSYSLGEPSFSHLIMAHRLSIPIRFEFLRTPAIWELRTVEGDRHHSAQLFAFSRVLSDDSLDAFKLTELDGWKRRDEFFEITDGNDAKLLKFLAKVGVWSNMEISGHWSQEVMRHCREGHPVPISVQGLWRFREGLKWALLNKREFRERDAPRLSRPETGLQLVQRSGIEFPLRFELESVASGLVTITDAYHMLLATVFADVARGIRFKTCKRRDCLRPFAIESKHVRIFCSQYCGHLVSQRKKRQKEQMEKRAERRRAKKSGK